MNTHTPLLWLGDDPAHARPAAWQTRWARMHGVQVVLQHADPVPLRGDWLVQLESVVRSGPRCRLIAQGLGCALVAAWAAYSSSYARVDSALLLGPFCPDAADPSGRYRTWRAVTPMPLPFPTWVIPDPGPSNSLSTQQQWAERWQAHWCTSLDPAGQREAMEAWFKNPRHSTHFFDFIVGYNTMVTKKPKGLGRGLEALLGPSVASTAQDATTAGGTSELDLSDLVPGMYQPRTRMDEGALYELAESIRAQGIMQPILVRRLSDGANAGKYEIIAGERRSRAAKIAGLERVPVLVRDVPNEAAAAMASIENIQREDLNPLEEAQGLNRLIREFGLTHEQAAQSVGRSRSAASNLLRLLNLAEPVQSMLMAGDLEMGHARALLSLDRAAQITAANQVAAKSMSVRETESLVKKLGAEFQLVTQKPKKEKSRDLRRIEEELSDLLTAEVEVRVKKRVKRNGRVEEMGDVSIQFGSLDELNGLIERLRGAD